MDLVWMTQNFCSVIALCFGSASLSATYLKNWADHMYENRLMYTSLQASNPFFFARVLFAIDNTLQIHWRSCSNTDDRLSVNDRVLFMNDIQDSILHHNFSQQLPKSISDKVQANLDSLKEKEGKFQGGYKQQGKLGNSLETNKHKEIVTDNDKNHSHLRLHDGENFAKVFYKNQRQCPRTQDNKQICMKFFLRGICDKSCTRSHKLTTEDEKELDKFIHQCREGASKPDF
jgi:hypothetical protein